MRIDIGQGVRLFVDVDGYKFAPNSDGTRLDERPTIVAMHGGPGLDHIGLRLGIAPLSDVAQLVVYDHRGHGRSDRRTSDEWNLDTWADDLVRLCDALGIEQPIVLGNSFGGFVAQRYTARHPGHASKVILYATRARATVEDITDGFRTFGGEEEAEAAKAFWSAPSEATARRYVELCRHLYTKSGRSIAADKFTMRNDEVLAHFLADEMWRLDHLASLSQASCPVLVLSGEHDPVCGPASTNEMVAALPASLTTWVSFANSSHAISADEPDAFHTAIRSFVLS